MLSQRRQIILSSFKLLDLFTMTFWFLMGAALESHEVSVAFGDFLAVRISMQNFIVFLGLQYAWHVNFTLFGLYYESRRLSTQKEEMVTVLKANTVAVAMVVLLALILRIRMATPLFLSIFWIGSLGTMVLSRVVIRSVLVALRKQGQNLRTMVIIGANSRSLQFAKKLESEPEHGYRVEGFIDDRDRAGTEVFEQLGYGYNLLTDLSGFETYLRSHVVDEVAVFLPLKSFYLEISKVIAACEEHGIIVRVPVQLFDLTMGRAEVEALEGVPALRIYTGAMQGPETGIKRLIDILFSAAFLVLLLPLFVTAAILIKITSSGPTFFVQERVGLNKRIFRLYKFRTMVADAEKKLAQLEHLNEASGPVFKIKHDPRITAIGRLLRMTSIDELPQLINVLRGDMSLVGPRPLPVRDYNGFDEDWHRRRFSVRPGVTCLWQVNGRSNVSFDKWMQLDMEYIDKWSLWLDLKILLRTVPAVLRGSGAS